MSITRDDLVALDFTIKKCSDGWFWLYEVHEDLFMQVNDSTFQIDLWEHGWVTDDLTEEEFDKAYAQLKAIKEYKEIVDDDGLR